MALLTNKLTYEKLVVKIGLQELNKVNWLLDYCKSKKINGNR